MFLVSKSTSAYRLGPQSKQKVWSNKTFGHLKPSAKTSESLIGEFLAEECRTQIRTVGPLWTNKTCGRLTSIYVWKPLRCLKAWLVIGRHVFSHFLARMPKSYSSVFTQTSFQGASRRACQSVVTFVSVQMRDRKPLNKQEPYLFSQLTCTSSICGVSRPTVIHM